MSTSTIQHVVVVPEVIAEGGTTFFQGFSRLLFPGYMEILSVLRFFPHDVSDCYLSGDDFVLSRMLGCSLDVRMVREDLIRSPYVDVNRPLVVIWSTSETAQSAQLAIDKFVVRPIHITSGECSGAISISDLNCESIFKHVDELLSRAAAFDGDLREFKKRLGSSPAIPRDAGFLGVIPKLHNCTAPLFDLLRDYGCRFESTETIEPCGEIKPHIDGMLELVKVIDGIRGKVARRYRERKNDALVYCPSFYSYLYRADSNHWNQLYRKLSRARRNFLRKCIIRGRGYGNGAVDIDELEVFNPYEDDVIGPLLWDRQLELGLFIAVVSVVALNQFVPAIRLPNAVMLHHDKLKNIYRLVDSSGHNRMKELNGKLVDYNRVLLEDMGEELASSVFAQRDKILAICDFPIEWFSVGLLPVMFKCEMSRIPSTPGNVTANILLAGQRLQFPYSVFSDVLIVRSFDVGDPIRGHLKKAVDIYRERGLLSNLNVSVVDVDNEHGLIDALNSFCGAIVVFDCHGGHDGEEGFAWLKIGREKVDVWHLYKRASSTDSFVGCLQYAPFGWLPCFCC